MMSRSPLVVKGLRGYPGSVTLTLLLSLAVSAQAAGPVPTCVKKTKQGYDEPRTLGALLRCQARARKGLAADEATTDAQQAEVHAYLTRHPDRADSGDDDGDDSGLKPEVLAQKLRSRQAATANAARLPAGAQVEYTELSEQLWGMSGDGQKGLTPQMAQEIVRYLQKQQGGVSVEMSDLLQTLSKDGSKLSHGSMRKLKKAARDAKGEGLDLGIEDESTERWMLDPTTDPQPGEKGPYPGQQDTGPPVN
ncbi:MAG: hypothetical protein FD126_768 [Elusimicrobia bacterium]|nr:MAG: hypothetical protein FD126_768 [Elusimicrobiota bacterium]